MTALFSFALGATVGEGAVSRRRVQSAFGL
jgi:hypothetical protein